MKRRRAEGRIIVHKILSSVDEFFKSREKIIQERREPDADGKKSSMSLTCMRIVEKKKRKENRRGRRQA
jgi:hypothetical protein